MGKVGGGHRAARVLVIGHARHGKDTAGEGLARRLGLPWVSSSAFACRRAVWPLVRDLYDTPASALADRDARREMWFHAIAAYNLRPGPSLAEEALCDHGLYVGLRKRSEFDAVRAMVDAVVWVDRSRVLPPEPGASMELTRGDADLIADNNAGLSELDGELDRVACAVFQAFKRREREENTRAHVARILHG